jgi:site-specific DNA-methyltransferase (adenine-specific)
MEYMKTIPDKFFSLSIVDPPYGIDVANINVGARGIKNNSCDGKEWDLLTPKVEYFNELKRISKNQIIWGANYFNCFSGGMGAIIWDKNQPLPTSSQCEIASYSGLKKVGLYRQTWTNYVNDKSTNHPTEKPVQLYKWLLRNYAKPGDKILDTHLGSQSSRIACYEGGFDFWGCELDEEYFNAGNKRFENYKLQLILF